MIKISFNLLFRPPDPESLIRNKGFLGFKIFSVNYAGLSLDLETNKTIKYLKRLVYNKEKHTVFLFNNLFLPNKPRISI
jgi:hypothetical protein